MDSLSTSQQTHTSFLARALPALPLGVGRAEPALPLASSEIRFELDDEYNDADLLLECTFAALWNSACLIYLLLPSTLTRELSYGSLDLFVAIMIFLVALPLMLGLAAGSSALTDLYEHRRWMKPVAKLATAGCFFGAWALLYLVFEGQNLWLQIFAALTTLCGQGIIISRCIHLDGRIRLGIDDVASGVMSEKSAFV